MKKVMSAAIIAATLVAAAGSAGAAVSENFVKCVQNERMGKHFDPGNPNGTEKTCQFWMDKGRLINE